MRIVTVKKAVPFGEIAGQVFAIDGQKGARVSQQAEAALRQANPHLADLKTVPEGTVILVPETEGLKPKAPSEPPVPAGADFAQLAGGLHVLGQNLLAAHNKEIEEAKETVALAKSKDFAKLANTGELKAQAAETVKTAQTRIKAAETSRQEMEKTLKQAGADLDELQRRFGGSGAPPKATT